MGDKTGIEWTDATWNPLRGCSIVSPGCHHCYAMEVAARFSGPGQPYEGLATRDAKGRARWTGEVREVPDKLDQPLRWHRPRRIFVNSMSDLFHDRAPTGFIDRVFGAMALADWHTYQVLTKRHGRMRDYLLDPETPIRIARHVLGSPELDAGPGSASWRKSYREQTAARLRGELSGPLHRGPYWPMPHVWLGVSVEDQARADERIPLLLQVPAAVRFLSCEPLLGPVDLRRIHVGKDCDKYDALRGILPFGSLAVQSYGPHVHWVIVGGESGPGARPMHPNWARGLRDQCRAAGVPFFFKQWGEWAPIGDDTPRGVRLGFVQPDGHISMAISGYEPGCPCDHSPREAPMVRVGKKAAGDLLDGVRHHAYPGEEGGRS